MCGRYSFVPSKPQFDAQLAEFERPAELRITYNLAPTQQGYVVTNDQPHTLQALTWGLVPFWSPDGANGGRLINARAEGIAAKPSFREPIRRRRCLVWADSFYEWRKGPGKLKTPYRIRMADGQLVCFAGIWDEWRREGKTLRTFSIITTEPNLEMSGLHNRMPMILPDRSARQRWLSDLPLDDILDLLHPLPDGLLAMYPVSDRVNSPAHDGPELHEKVDAPATLL